MSINRITIGLLFLLLVFLSAELIAESKSCQLVLLKTNYGEITLRLMNEAAPITTANFLNYVESGRFDGTLFHRVAKDHVIQGGGYDKQMQPIETLEPIINEAKNGVLNLRGRVAMARYTSKDSADSQFFINLKDNSHLDHRNDTNLGFGYAVFAEVVSGMEVVDEIARLPVGEVSDVGDQVPAYPVILQEAQFIKNPKASESALFCQ